MNLEIQKLKNMLYSFKIDGEKHKKLKLAPWSKFQKKIRVFLDISIKLSKYPKIFQKPQNLREEMHFEIYKSEPHWIPIQKKFYINEISKLASLAGG